MDIFSFGLHFTYGPSCRPHFKGQGDKEGVTCHRCQGRNAKISLRRGTIAQSSKLSFMVRHGSMFLLSNAKKGLSSKGIRPRSGPERYGPVRATGHRPGRHTLKSMVEAEEGHFTIAFTDKSTSYVNIADYADISISGKLEKSTTEETLERVPMAIGNAERDFVGTYHKIKIKYLRSCPNGSVHKIDAGYFGERIFDGQAMAGITATRH